MLGLPTSRYMQTLIWGCKVDSPTIPDRLGSTFTSIYLTPWARKCALIPILKHMKCWRTSENPIQEHDFTPSLHENENSHGMKLYHHLFFSHHIRCSSCPSPQIYFTGQSSTLGQIRATRPNAVGQGFPAIQGHLGGEAFNSWKKYLHCWLVV